jgi:hypothetical protein
MRKIQRQKCFHKTANVLSEVETIDFSSRTKTAFLMVVRYNLIQNCIPEK